MEEPIVQSRLAIVIHSPHSGRSAQLADTLSYLRQTPLEIADVISIADLDGLPPQGPQWRARGITLAIAAGGDGLVGGVIYHIISSDISLGIVPLGTANDTARAIGIPQDVQQAVEILAHGQEREIDVGEAQPAEQTPHNASSSQNTPARSHFNRQQHGFFAHALTVGLNVQFARLATNVAIRQRFGSLTYPVAALEVLRKHQALDLTLTFEGLVSASSNPSQPAPLGESTPPTMRCRALLAAVINAPLFGGQWRISIPGASVSDRLLDIVVIDDIDLESLSTSIISFINHQEQPPTPTTSPWHASHSALHAAELSGLPGIHHLRAREVIITTQDDPQDATLDGEIRGQTPAHVYTSEKRLHVLVPRKDAHAQ